MTEINKLEIKHIQHYPIGGENALQVKTDRTSLIHEVKGILEGYLFISDFEVPIRAEYCIPLLRPMSDLYKEINGKIGIVELIHIAYGAKSSDIENCKVIKNGDEYKVQYQSSISKDILFTIEMFYSNGIWIYLDDGDREIINTLPIFEYLFSHHYDVFGLHRQGLADIKTR